MHDDALVGLGNLRALAWVMQAEGAFQTLDPSLFSFTTVADRLWEHWTGGEARFQNLLIRLAEREANFERSFAIGELDIGDAQAFDACPPEVPLRRNARHRIEFAHDLAADWTRFQRLKEIADDVPRWSALAKNPLWHGALRMLGQYLLREPADGGRTQWDDAFGVAEGAKDTAPLAADVLRGGMPSSTAAPIRLPSSPPRSPQRYCVRSPEHRRSHTLQRAPNSRWSRFHEQSQAHCLASTWNSPRMTGLGAHTKPDQYGNSLFRSGSWSFSNSGPTVKLAVQHPRRVQGSLRGRDMPSA
jgi:hypothetical protein